MARRTFVTGFEGGAGHTGHYQPNDANIAVDATHVRTGAYALKIAGQSSTASYLILGAATMPNATVLFARFYLYFTSFPSGSRNLLGTTSGNLAGYPNLRIGAGGNLIVGSNGVDLATGTTALSLNAWHCVEVGINTTQHKMAVRLEGNTELGWTDYGAGGPSSISTLVVGAISAEPGAFTYWLDDVAFDQERWCEPGRVAAIPLTSISLDSAQWSAVGTVSKLTAVTDGDDATYLLSSTTSSSNIRFGLGSLPGDLVQARGWGISVRGVKDGASTTSIPVSIATGFAVANNTNGFSTGTTIVWDQSIAGSYTGLSSSMSSASLASSSVSLSSTTVAARIQALLFELDYASDPAARPHPHRAAVAGCDTGDTSEFNGVAGSGGNLPAASTTVVRTGAYSVVCQNPTVASGSDVYITTGSAFPGTNFFTLFGRFYVYFATLPSSGTTLDLMCQTPFTAGQRSHGIRVKSDGSISLTDSRDGSSGATTAGFSSAGVIQVGTWQRIEWQVQCQSVSGANDGIGYLYVDGILVQSITNGQFGTGFASTQTHFGIWSSSTASQVTLYLDDIVLDYGALPGASKILDYEPTTIGSLNPGTWSLGAGASLAGALAETPTDDDASYITAPASSASADAISFAFGDLPSTATLVQSVQLSIRSRTSTTGNQSFRVGITSDNLPATNAQIVTVASQSYGWNRHLLWTTDTAGAWTTGLYDGSEIYLAPSSISGTPGTRITNVRVTAEYVETSAGYKELAASAYLIGTTTKEVPADGWVVQLATTKTTQTTADAWVGGLKTLDLVADALLSVSGVVSSTNQQQLFASGYVVDLSSTKTKQVSASGVVSTASLVTLPSRLYFDGSSPAWRLSAPKGQWSWGAGFTQGRLGVPKLGAYSTSTIFSFKASGTFGRLGFVYLSDPLAAQTLQGQAQVALIARANTLDRNYVYQIHIWVTQGDTQTVRGVALDSWVDSSGTIWDGTLDGHLSSLVDLSPVAVNAGDRLVVEVGAYNLVSTRDLLPAFTLGRGGTGADLTENALSGAGWINITAPTIGSDPITDVAEVQGDALIQISNTAQTTASAIVLATKTSEIASSAIVTTASQKELAASALVQRSDLLEATSDALVQRTAQSELTSDAVLLGTPLTEAHADALVQTSFVLETDASAILQATQTSEADADALVQQTSALDVGANADLQATQVLESEGDGLIAQAMTLELSLDALLAIPQTLELGADAKVFAPLSAVETIADAYLVRRPGWVRITARLPRSLDFTTRVTGGEEF